MLFVQPEGSKGYPLPPLGVHVAPGPPGYIPLCAENQATCPDRLIHLVATGDHVEIVATQAPEAGYDHFSLSLGGQLTAADDLPNATVTASALSEPCSCQGLRGDVTL